MGDIRNMTWGRFGHHLVGCFGQHILGRLGLFGQHGLGLIIQYNLAGDLATIALEIFGRVLRAKRAKNSEVTCLARINF